MRKRLFWYKIRNNTKVTQEEIEFTKTSETAKASISEDFLRENVNLFAKIWKLFLEQEGQKKKRMPWILVVVDLITYGVLPGTYDFSDIATTFDYSVTIMFGSETATIESKSSTIENSWFHEESFSKKTWS